MLILLQNEVAARRPSSFAPNSSNGAMPASLESWPAVFSWYVAKALACLPNDAGDRWEVGDANHPYDHDTIDSAAPELSSTGHIRSWRADLYDGHAIVFVRVGRRSSFVNAIEGVASNAVLATTSTEPSANLGRIVNLDGTDRERARRLVKDVRGFDVITS
ncbi:hypothetical protein SCHPADRAFT_947891 [Schizopora paradoxa]|uniref:Uncharacterized protein n=1 Tax=Schizopora paradoxa TaxID=27342 RepID=A0A0H2R3X2_9AGAM|nr:hypothetical protein SCHPADRAFT_947891 [Schizopora paradoxa]